jgi:hypothetical protein
MGNDLTRSKLCNSIIKVKQSTDNSTQQLESLLLSLIISVDSSEVVRESSLLECQAAFSEALSLVSRGYLQNSDQSLSVLFVESLSKFADFFYDPSASVGVLLKANVILNNLQVIANGLLGTLSFGEQSLNIISDNLLISLTKQIARDNVDLRTPLSQMERSYGKGLYSSVELSNEAVKYLDSGSGYLPLMFMKFVKNPYLLDSSKLRSAVYLLHSNSVYISDIKSSLTVDYYVVIQFSETQDFDFGINIEQALVNGITNFTFPELTAMNDNTTWVTCNVSSYNNYNVSFVCIDLLHFRSISNMKMYYRSLATESSSSYRSLSFGVSLTSPEQIILTDVTSSFEIDNQKVEAVLIIVILLFNFIVVGYILFLRWDYMYSDRNGNKNPIMKLLPLKSLKGKRDKGGSGALFFNWKKMNKVNDEVQDCNHNNNLHENEIDDLYGIYDDSDEFLSTPLLSLLHNSIDQTDAIENQDTIFNSMKDAVAKVHDTHSSNIVRNTMFQSSIPCINPTSLLPLKSDSQRKDRMSIVISPSLVENNSGNKKHLIDQFDHAIASILSVADESSNFNYLLKHHEYFTMFYQLSIRNTRTIRWTHVVLRVIIFLFVTTVFYGVFYPDDGSCQSHEAEHTCLSDTNMLSNGQQCTWTIDYSYSDTRTIESTCALNVPTSLIYIMILATLTMIVSIPLIIFYKSLMATFGSYYADSNRYSSYITADPLDNHSLSVLRRNQASISHVAGMYSDLLSPEEEVNRLLDEVKKVLIEYSDNSTEISIYKAAKIKAIRQLIGINADGSPSPLDFFDRLQYGSQRAKLIAKIRLVRNRAIFIKTALKNECKSTNSKEIMFMQFFILEQFTSIKQYILSRLFFTFPLINPSLISPVSWTCAWSVIVLSIAFFFYWILNWVLSQGGATFWLWILNFGICLSLDIFIVQSIYAYAMFVFLMKSITAQLKKIRQVLSNIDISNKQKATDFRTEFKVLSYLSPFYRLLRRSRECACFSSEAMLNISDYDLFLCREDANMNSTAYKIGIYLISGLCSNHTGEIFVLTASSSVIPLLIMANFYLYLLIKNFIIILYVFVLFYFLWMIGSKHFYKFRSVECLDNAQTQIDRENAQTLSDSALWLKSEAPPWSLGNDFSNVTSFFFIMFRSLSSQLYNFSYNKRMTNFTLETKKKKSWKLMNRPINSIRGLDRNSIVKKIPVEEIQYINLLRPTMNIIIDTDSSTEGGYIQFLVSSAKKCLKKKGVIGFAVGDILYRSDDFPTRESSSRVKLYRQTHICDVENNASDIDSEKKKDYSAAFDGVHYMKEDEKINSDTYFVDDIKDDKYDENDKSGDGLYIDDNSDDRNINDTYAEMHAEEVFDGRIVEVGKLNSDDNQENKFNSAEEENLSGHFIDRVIYYSENKKRHIVDDFDNDDDDDNNNNNDNDNDDDSDGELNNDTSSDNDDITKMLRLLTGSDSSDDNSTLSSNALMVDNTDRSDIILTQASSKQQLFTYEELSTTEKVEPFLSSLEKYKQLKSQPISSTAMSKSNYRSLTLSPKEKLNMLKVLVVKSNGDNVSSSEIYRKLKLSNVSNHLSMIKQSESTRIDTSSSILLSTSSDLNRSKLFDVTNSNSRETNSVTSSDELKEKLPSLDRYQQLLKKTEYLLHNFKPKECYINRKSSFDENDETNKNNITDHNNSSNLPLVRLNKYNQLLLNPFKETEKSTSSRPKNLNEEENLSFKSDESLRLNESTRKDNASNASVPLYRDQDSTIHPLISIEFGIPMSNQQFVTHSSVANISNATQVTTIDQKLVDSWKFVSDSVKQQPNKESPASLFTSDDQIRSKMPSIKSEKGEYMVKSNLHQGLEMSTFKTESLHQIPFNNKPNSSIAQNQINTNELDRRKQTQASSVDKTTTLKALQRYDAFLRRTKGSIESKISSVHVEYRRSLSPVKRVETQSSPHKRRSSLSEIVHRKASPVKSSINSSIYPFLPRRSSVTDALNKAVILPSRSNIAVSPILNSKNSKFIASKSVMKAGIPNYARANFSSFRRSSMYENSQINKPITKQSSVSSSFSDKRTAASAAKRSSSVMDVPSTKMNIDSTLIDRRSLVMTNASNKAKNSTTTHALLMDRRSTISNNRCNELSSSKFNNGLDSITHVIVDDSSSSKSQTEENNMIQVDVESIVTIKIPQLEEMSIKIDTSIQEQPTMSESSKNPASLTNLSNIDTSHTRRPSLIPYRPSSGLNHNRVSDNNMRNRNVTRQSSYTQQPPSNPNSNISQPSQDEPISSNISIIVRDDIQQFSRDSSYRLSSMVHNSSNPLRKSMLQKRQDSSNMKMIDDNCNGSNSRSSLKK